MYKNKIHFFESAAQIHPDKFKWRLMVISCYQRMGDFTKDLKFSKKLTKKTLKMLSVSNYLFAGVTSIMFSCLSEAILKTWENFTLTIRFKAFDCILQRNYSDNDASLL